MGRFSHEAVAVDPVTGYVYETEDAGNSSGFYRFVPNDRTDLHQGGQLYMMRLPRKPGAWLASSFFNGFKIGVDWVRVPQPDNPARTMPGNFVWAQGRAAGGATFARLEGCWYGNDRKITGPWGTGGL